MMPRMPAATSSSRPSTIVPSPRNKVPTTRIATSSRRRCMVPVGVIFFAVVSILVVSYDIRSTVYGTEGAYHRNDPKDEERTSPVESRKVVQAGGSAASRTGTVLPVQPVAAAGGGGGGGGASPAAGPPFDKRRRPPSEGEGEEEGREDPAAQAQVVRQIPPNPHRPKPTPTRFPNLRQQQQHLHQQQKMIESNLAADRPDGEPTRRPPRPQVVSTLLPAPLDYVRRNMSLQEIYDYPRDRRFTGDCSCENSRALQECCFRVFRRCHKMGVVMTRNTFKNIRPPVYKFSRDPFELDYTQDVPRSDYRDVLLFRNIYDALISGYQYHKLGRECWTDTKGKPMDESAGRDRWRSVYYWYKVIRYEPNPPRNGRSLCRYLEQESEEDGLRAYIEYIFHSQYVVMFSHLALAVSDIREVKQRTMVICYEDIVNPTTANTVLNRALQFFYNNATDRSYAQGPPGSTSLKEQHAAGTSLETAEKERLRRIIHDIDRKYYHNDIAWLDSIIPC